MQKNDYSSPNKKNKKGYKSSKKFKGFICERCGDFTFRSILGIYICKNCYDYEFINYESKKFDNSFDKNGISKIGHHILNCNIKFNPDLIICKGSGSNRYKKCPFFNDCSIHHVLIKPQKNLNV